MTKGEHFDILVPSRGEIMTMFSKRKLENTIEERYFENITMSTKLYQVVIDHL